jgi:WD40 repeat protein
MTEVGKQFMPTIPCSIFICALLIGCSQRPLEPTDTLEVARIGLTSATLADNGSHVLVGSVHDGISYWRIGDGEQLFDWNHKKNERATMLAADLSPGGAWALTADLNTLVLWDTKTGAALRYWQTPGEVLSLQLGENGDTALLGMSNNTAVLFNVRKGGIVHTLKHELRVGSVALSDDGRVAITGSADYSARAWDLRTGKLISTVPQNDEVLLVAISHDGELAFSMSKYDRALVWSTADGTILGKVPLTAQGLKRGLRYTSARFSHDKRWLLTGRPDQLVTLWQLPEMTQKAQWQVTARNRWKPMRTTILDVAFGADDNTFYAVGANGMVYQLKLP